jgi:anti-sigma factor RsiW
MVKNDYNEKLIAQYLLGDLPQPEVKRLDELSFTDDDFFHRLQAVENDLIDASVRGELSLQEREQFQEHFLATPKRRERVEFAKALAAFEVEEPAVETLAPSQPATVSWWQSWLSSFRAPRLVWQFSLAVTAIVLLVGSWLIVETVRLRGRLAQIQEERATLIRREQELQARLTGQRADREQLANELRGVQKQRDQLERELETLRQSESTFAFFVLTRGVRGGDTKDLTISSKTTTVKLRLEFESDDYPAYRAVLKTQSDDKEVWASGRLKARQKGASKSVEVNIPARLLEARGYRLDLKAIKVSGDEDDVRGYPFRIVKR